MKHDRAKALSLSVKSFLQGLKGSGIWTVKVQSICNVKVLCCWIFIGMFLLFSSGTEKQEALVNSPCFTRCSKSRANASKCIPINNFFSVFCAELWGCCCSPCSSLLPNVFFFCLGRRLETSVNWVCFHWAEQTFPGLKCTQQLGLNSESKNQSSRPKPPRMEKTSTSVLVL